ncbi:MAG TPA: hypothetical protein DCF62_06445 [Porticoccaceae bacterium]|nr:hypothetical protein [Porticoccaceae bacterium]HCO61242.1 hypothetical protein [Porticoccaceae bacterium]
MVESLKAYRGSGNKVSFRLWFRVTGVLASLLLASVVVRAEPGSAKAFEFQLLSVGVRSRVGEKRVLGEEQPDSFRVYDAIASFQLPWVRDLPSGWNLDGRLLTSAGVLRGADKTALAVSAIPVLALEWPERFVLDGGIGLAALSRHRYAQQDFGGHLQFALSAGLGVAVYRNIWLGYRYQHYSDASVYGSNTIGADFHMLELNYRF